MEPSAFQKSKVLKLDLCNSLAVWTQASIPVRFISSVTRTLPIFGIPVQKLEGTVPIYSMCGALGVFSGQGETIYETGCQCDSK